MRITFVRPMASMNQFILMPPLNYLHLAAFLREQGHTPFIFDKVLKKVDNLAIDTHIRNQKIKIVGIGCMTCEFPDAVAEAKRLKSAFPGLIIVFGGAHPSADPEECLKTGVVDYVVVGEGELALSALLTHLEKGIPVENIPGIWSMDDGLVLANQPATTPGIDDLPFPAYDLLNLQDYYKLNLPWHFPKRAEMVPFISSRGCPYRCSYCHNLHGKSYRGQSAEWVVDQLEYLVRVLGVREIMMVDDIFNFNLERAKAICRGIIDRKLDLTMQFPNGVRGDRFDEELVALMAKAGTHFMAVAIETVSVKFQKLIRKNLKIDKAYQTVLWAKKYGIEVCGFFMIGFPGETKEEIKETLDFAVGSPFDNVFINIVTPYKGTELRKDITDGRFGMVGDDAMAALEGMIPEITNNEVDRKTLIRMQRVAYWRFYLKPFSLYSLSKKMTKSRNWRKIFNAVKRRISQGEIVSVN